MTVAEPVEWVTNGGKTRWQPQRADGVRLVFFCGFGGCHSGWGDTDRPKTYRWRWRAVLRGAIGDWLWRKRVARELDREVAQ